MNNILPGYLSNHFSDFNALRANGTITNVTPADGTMLDPYWARRARQAYWAAVSFTDDNVGAVVAAAKASGLWEQSVVVLWGDHGYQLGENDQWSKVSDFEQATRIPLLIRAPGAKANGQRTSALWEAVDLLPMVADLAMGDVPPACPATLAASRATDFCTDGKSAASLLAAPGNSSWSRRAFSQVPRGAIVNGEPGDIAGERYMGYTVRVADWRYTEWVEFDPARGVANWTKAALHGVGLYAEALGRSCRCDTDSHNVASNPAHAAVVEQLSAMLRTIV